MLMDQLSMFDQPRRATNVRPDDPDTSHAAAAPTRPTLRRDVWNTLAANPDGLTDWELTTALGLDRRRKPSVGKRRQEAGAIDTGQRRRSPDGYRCIVWRLP